MAIPGLTWLKYNQAVKAYLKALEPANAPLGFEVIDEVLWNKGEGDVEEIVHFAYSDRALALPSGLRNFATAEHLFEVAAPSDRSSPFLSAEPQETRDWFLKRVTAVLEILDADQPIIHATKGIS